MGPPAFGMPFESFTRCDNEEIPPGADRDALRKTQAG
jgi:hypothetical protein